MSAVSCVVALTLVAAPAISNPAPKPPSRVRTPAKPTALAGPPPRQQPDERQAKLMQEMGFKWDGKRWGRGGDPSSRERARASCRSGNRFARLVDAAGEPAAGHAAAIAGIQRFETLLQAAREGALQSSEAARARSTRIKDLVVHPLAPAAYIAAQLAVICILFTALHGGFGALGAPAVPGDDSALAIALGSGLQGIQTELERATPGAIGIGLAFGALAALCRSVARAAMPGVEEPDGALERLLADGLEGAHALPTPTHIRFESTEWRARALAFELLAGVAVSLALQAGAQAACLEGVANALAWRLVDAASGSDFGQQAALIGPAAAALLVSLPAGVRAALHAAPPHDGIPAECTAATRAKRGAESYFSMCPPLEGEPGDAAATLSALADGWLAKFDKAPGAPPPQVVQAAGALGASLCYALAWQLASGALLAPVLARAVAAASTYVPVAGSVDPEAARVTVRLPTLASEAQGAEGDKPADAADSADVKM